MITQSIFTYNSRRMQLIEHELFHLIILTMKEDSKAPLIGTKKRCEVYPPHPLLAQKVNNRASFLLMKSDYDEGIVLLTKALKLVDQKLSSSKTSEVCTCERCCFESCLNMEQDSYLSLLESLHAEQSSAAQSRNEKRKHHPSSCQNKDRVCIDGKDYHDEKHNEYQHHVADKNRSLADIKMQDGFVYSRPLLIPKNCIEECHYVGIGLSMILLYNLALAHHLKGIAMHYQPLPNTKDSMQLLKNALQLYELAYQLHLDYIQKPTTRSATDASENNDGTKGLLRFTMIISNNLGQIHRMVGDTDKHEMCLQHLLSTIMYMVDCKVVVLDSSEMDGFYRNVSPIMLSSMCADAA